MFVDLSLFFHWEADWIKAIKALKGRLPLNS